MALIIVILINAFKHICEIHEEKLVASSGIEPESGASETLILSPSERRSAGRALYYEAGLLYQAAGICCKHFYGNSQQNYAKKLSYSH